MRRLLLFALFLFVASAPAAAQRLIAGQNTVFVHAYGWKECGGDIGWARMYDDARFVAKGMCLFDEDDYDCDAVDELPAVSFGYRAYDILASAGYQWRVVGNRSRSFNLWAGLSLDLGARVYSFKDGTYPYKVPRSNFLYGGGAQVEFEFFLFRSFAVSLMANPRVQLYGDKKMDRIFFPNGGIGFTYYFM